MSSTHSDFVPQPHTSAAAGSLQANQLDGISWSCCHNSPVSWDYCGPIVEQSAAFGVKRLELAADVPGFHGNIDAFVYFTAYPHARDEQGVQMITSNIENARRVCRRAHELGIEVDIWHREVCFPEVLLESEKGLLNEDGDIDFQGPYLDLIRRKAEEFFANVPEMDGLVLTLTEAMFPIIHVANKQLNPPERNIENVVRTFKEVCDARGKRFMIRPFAALSEDYAYLKSVILKMKSEANFTTQIKVLPADWHAYLPINSMIDDLAETRRMVEIDLLGEYFGHGQVPCCCPGEVKRYVEALRSRNIPRAVVRIDRSSTRCTDIANGVNLLAMHRFWDDPEADIDQMYLDWATDRYDAVTARRVVGPLKKTFDIARNALYLDRHNISHWAYLDFGMLKWSRFFGFFRPGEPLRRTVDEWAILSERVSPSFEQILGEKERAVELADQCVREIDAAKDAIHADAYAYLHDGFVKWAAIARAYRQLCRLAIAYVHVIRGEVHREHFDLEVQNAEVLGAEIERELGGDFYGGIAGQVRDNAAQMSTELAIELDIAQRNNADAEIVDWILCGGISFEWAVRKQTHGSWVYRDGDVIYRRAGNKAIADGFFEYEMQVPSGDSTLRLLWGDTGEQRQAYLDIDGKRQTILAGGVNGFAWIEVPLHFERAATIPIRITKKSKLEPRVSQLQIRRK